MQISPIRTIQPNNINFKAKLVQQQSTGYLQRATSYEVEGILHAYRDIITKLGCKTEEGLNYIRKNFPNITIGEGLIFHNCGKDNLSILIRCAEDPQYVGLTRIIVREGQSSKNSHKVKDSFMLYCHDRAVTNFDETHSKQYPREAKLATADELKMSGYDERLRNTIKDLDGAMLLFRIFLSKNENIYRKNPDGKLLYQAQNKLNVIDKLTEKVESIESKTNHSKLYYFKKDFKSYVLTSGLKAISFRNVGPEQLTILCSNISTTKHENLKRLVVSDKNGKVINVYLVKDNLKLVKNFNKNTKVIPDKLTYYDEAELNNTELVKDFEKYMSMYSGMLYAYSEGLTKLIEEPIKSPTFLLGTNLREKFQEVMNLYDQLMQKLQGDGKKYSYSSMLRNSGVEYASAVRGVTFNDYNGDKKLQILPINSKKYDGLLRLTISNSDNTEREAYLIKDLKYIVSNYNPDYPLVLPKTLAYQTVDTFSDDNKLTPCLDFLKKKFTEILCNIQETKPIEQAKLVVAAKPIPKIKHKKNSSFVNECTEIFKSALKDINSSTSGLENFKITLQELGEKVTQYYSG